jgi:Na+-driven multidrug efflux pump
VTYQFCLVWGLIAALILAVIGSVVAGLVDASGPVIETAGWYLTVVPWSYGLWGVLMMASASFNALGKPLPSTALSFSRMFIVYIPMAMLLDHFYGYRGIFIATALSNALMGVLGYLWFRNRFFSRMT